MAESNQNSSIPEAEIAEFKRANGVLVSLMTTEVGVLQIQAQRQEIWCTTLSIAVAVIVIYFIAMLAVIFFSARCSPIHRRVWERTILLLGGLAAVLPLLILLPPFGWLTLLLWAVSFTVFAKSNHQMITKVEYRSILVTLISSILGLVECGGEADQTGDSLPQ